MRNRSVIINPLWSVLVLTVTAMADPISQPVTFGGHVLGTLSVATLYDTSEPSPNNAFISAAFEDSSGSLNGTAEAIGGNHFNWLQIVTSGTTTAGVTPQNVPYPFIDPLSGGNNPKAGQTSDRLPYYWSETGGSNSELETAIDGNKLGYSDQPVNFANTTLHFETYLVDADNAVAQSTPATFTVLAGFNWTFLENAQGKGSTISDVSFFPPNEAFVDSALAQPYNFPGWSATATTAVPEPRFLFPLSLLGLLLLFRTRTLSGITHKIRISNGRASGDLSDPGQLKTHNACYGHHFER